MEELLKEEIRQVWAVINDPDSSSETVSNAHKQLTRLRNALSDINPAYYFYRGNE